MSIPGAIVNATGPVQNVPNGYHHGWLVQILPYLDRGDFDGMIDDTAGIYAPANLQARRAVLASLVCPSDVGPLRRADGMADGDYAGCHHDTERPINTNQNGILYLNSRVRYDDIPDGSACTIAVGEKRRLGLDLGWASGTRASLRNPGNRNNAVDDAYSMDLLKATPKKQARRPCPSPTRDPTTRSGSADSAADTPASSASPSATDRRDARWIAFLHRSSGSWPTGMMESYLKIIYGEFDL